VSFAAITLCVTSQRVFVVVVTYFVMTQSGNFWIYPRTSIQTHIFGSYKRIGFQMIKSDSL
jgi:hypothetical protein